MSHCIRILTEALEPMSDYGNEMLLFLGKGVAFIEALRYNGSRGGAQVAAPLQMMSGGGDGRQARAVSPF